MIFCHKCGSQESDDSMFCHKCGTKLATDEDIGNHNKQSSYNSNTASQRKTYSDTASNTYNQNSQRHSSDDISSLPYLDKVYTVLSEHQTECGYICSVEKTTYTITIEGKLLKHTFKENTRVWDSELKFPFTIPFIIAKIIKYILGAILVYKLFTEVTAITIVNLAAAIILLGSIPEILEVFIGFNENSVIAKYVKRTLASSHIENDHSFISNKFAFLIIFSIIWVIIGIILIIDNVPIALKLQEFYYTHLH